MFSKSCEYAIKAVLYLCVHTKDGSKLSIKDLSRAIDSPEPFTAKILQTLARKKIVSSSKGPHGGFYLGPDAKPIYVMDIVDIIDGKDAFERCGLGLKACDANHPCPIHKQFASYSAKLKNLLETKTVQSMAKRVEQGKVFLNNIG